MSPDLLDDKAPALSDTSCSEIDWKAGKNLTVVETVKKQKAKSGKNKGQVRQIYRLCFVYGDVCVCCAGSNLITCRMHFLSKSFCFP